MQISTFKLEWKRRDGGSGKTQRDFLDYIVNNESLLEKIGGDVISCLGWFIPPENAKTVNQLMLKADADLPNNRYILYICPECGDINCGAVTAVIERVGDTIIWRDFGFQNGYENEIHLIEDIDIFVFDRAQYRNTLRGAL